MYARKKLYLLLKAIIRFVGELGKSENYCRYEGFAVRPYKLKETHICRLV
jgi:hypothetical protein